MLALNLSGQIFILSRVNDAPPLPPPPPTLFRLKQSELRRKWSETAKMSIDNEIYEDNIEMNLQEIDCDDVNYFEAA